MHDENELPRVKTPHKIDLNDLASLLDMILGHAVAQRVPGHFEEPTGF